MRTRFSLLVIIPMIVLLFTSCGAIFDAVILAVYPEFGPAEEGGRAAGEKFIELDVELFGPVVDQIQGGATVYVGLVTKNETQQGFAIGVEDGLRQEFNQDHERVDISTDVFGGEKFGTIFTDFGFLRKANYLALVWLELGESNGRPDDNEPSAMAEVIEVFDESEFQPVQFSDGGQFGQPEFDFRQAGVAGFFGVARLSQFPEIDPRIIQAIKDGTEVLEYTITPEFEVEGPWNIDPNQPVSTRFRAFTYDPQAESEISNIAWSLYQAQDTTGDGFYDSDVLEAQDTNAVRPVSDKPYIFEINFPIVNNTSGTSLFPLTVGGDYTLEVEVTYALITGETFFAPFFFTTDEEEPNQGSAVNVFVDIGLGSPLTEPPTDLGTGNHKIQATFFSSTTGLFSDIGSRTKESTHPTIVTDVINGEAASVSLGQRAYERGPDFDGVRIEVDATGDGDFVDPEDLVSFVNPIISTSFDLVGSAYEPIVFFDSWDFFRREEVPDTELQQLQRMRALGRVQRRR